MGLLQIRSLQIRSMLLGLYKSGLCWFGPYKMGTFEHVLSTQCTECLNK
jgi:hypothetical protein